MDAIEYKLCGRCDTWQQPENFGFRDKAQTRRQLWCLACLVEYKRVWYLRHRDEHIEHVRVWRAELKAVNRAKIEKLKAAHPCVDCGENDPIVLEFDHLRDKRWQISDMVAGGFPWETIEAELAKCALRCANCHRRKTKAERLGRWPTISEEVGIYALSDNWRHGPLAQLDRAATF